MFLFCIVFAMFCARLFICALWSPAGKGLTSWLSCVVSSVSLSLSHWYPGSGVVLDCIDSWSLQPYYFLTTTVYHHRETIKSNKHTMKKQRKGSWLTDIHSWRKPQKENQTCVNCLIWRKINNMRLCFICNYGPSVQCSFEYQKLFKYGISFIDRWNLLSSL